MVTSWGLWIRFGPVVCSTPFSHFPKVKHLDYLTQKTQAKIKCLTTTYPSNIGAKNFVPGTSWKLLRTFSAEIFKLFWFSAKWVQSKESRLGRWHVSTESGLLEKKRTEKKSLEPEIFTPFEEDFLIFPSNLYCGLPFSTSQVEADFKPSGWCHNTRPSDGSSHTSQERNDGTLISPKPFSLSDTQQKPGEMDLIPPTKLHFL